MKNIETSKYIFLQNVKNELQKNLTNLIMLESSLSMQNRIDLVRSLSIDIVEDKVKISSSLGGKFYALNNGTATFKRPFNWLERALEMSSVNLDSIVKGALSDAY